MGLFGGDNKHESSDDGPEKPAVKYVREIIAKAIKSGINEIDISNENGNALCVLSADTVPYVNVRNRIAIMTDTISVLNNIREQTGIIQIRMGKNAYYIHAIDKPYKSGISLVVKCENPNQSLKGRM